MPAPKPRSVTLGDVAARAGVHVSTVSRVLKGYTDFNLRPETRERIHQAAADLHYRPNAVAQALRNASTGTLGMLVPSLRNPVYAEIVRGAFDRAWEREFVIVLAEDRGAEDAERAYERLVEQGRIDGLLIAGVRPDSILPSREANARVPFVFVNRRHPYGHNVSMREEDAAMLAAEHLLELGHSHLAQLAGPPDIDTARRRESAFRAVVARAGATVETVHAEFDERAAFQAMRELMRRDGPPTAVFVSNINQAIGALAGVRDLGRQVPEDVSVVTYDDDPISEFLAPPLTSVRMPLALLGAAAVDAVLDRIDGGKPSDVTVPEAPLLIRRSSTAPPPPRS